MRPARSAVALDAALSDNGSSARKGKRLMSFHRHSLSLEERCGDKVWRNILLYPLSYGPIVAGHAR